VKFFPQKWETTTEWFRYNPIRERNLAYLERFLPRTELFVFDISRSSTIQRAAG
jgi:hypothetical protein